MKTDDKTNDSIPHDPIAQTDIAAWEEIAPGRYMPRRVRGSCRGRVLG